MLAALSDRTQLPPFNRAFLGLILASHRRRRRSARCCCLLTPERLFDGMVPLLLGFATVLFAFAERIGAWMRAARAEAARRRPSTFSVTSLTVLLPVSVYGGYFGAGVGMLLLGVLSVATGGDYRSRQCGQEPGVRASTRLVASIVFIAQGRGDAGRRRSR